ncbi:MAG: hypothetical protein DRI86_03420 [Bacteroidetes bacterium]|nr:MAG: hypothetical protein DRI86_03420 [Bacteroidota bacterium]
MAKYVFILILVLSIGSKAFAQNYKKTFKALEEKNYTSARIGFQQAQQSVNTKSLGNYGMAVVYRSTSLRIEDMYKACASINNAKENWGEYDEKFKKKYSGYLTEDIINKEKITIDKKLFSMLLKSNNAKSIQEFIDKCPNTSFKKEALLLRDSLAYNKAASFNTISAFKAFIKDYPNAKQVNLAQSNLYQLAWNSCISRNEVDGYEAFITNYSGAPQIDSAKSLIVELEYQHALNINTNEAFSSFISKYPNSPKSDLLIKKGEENAFNNVLKFEVIPICNKFIDTYPKSKKLWEVVKIRDSLAFVEVKLINTNEAYEDFLFTYPNAVQVPLALSLMTESMYSRAEINKMIAKTNIKTNNIKSVIIYRSEDKDSSIRAIESRKKYDVFGNMISEKEEISPKTKKETKYIFDDAGDKLIKKMTFLNDKIQELTEFEYDIKGLNILSNYQCQFNCDNYGKIYNDTLKYDEKRNLLSSVKYNYSSKKIEAHYYTYDIKGNRIQDSLQTIIGDSLDYYIITINYNGQGNVIQELKENSKGEKLSVRSYSYDGLGKLITSSTYDASGTIYRTYFYNSKGLLESDYLSYEEYKDSGVRHDYEYEIR